MGYKIKKGITGNDYFEPEKENDIERIKHPEELKQQIIEDNATYHELAKGKGFINEPVTIGSEVPDIPTEYYNLITRTPASTSSLTTSELSDKIAEINKNANKVNMYDIIGENKSRKAGRINKFYSYFTPEEITIVINKNGNSYKLVSKTENEYKKFMISNKKFDLYAVEFALKMCDECKDISELREKLKGQLEELEIQ